MITRAALLLLLAACTAPFARAADDDDPEPGRKGLVARIVVKSKLPLEADRLEWELVLTNQGGKPVRVCTLCGGGGGSWEGHVEKHFTPDHWKSDRPRDEEFGKHIVTLKAGQ